MNQYRVSLWVESQGSLPDCDMQFQMVNVSPNSGKLAIAAFLLAGKVWARLIEVRVLSGDQWVEVARAANVTLYGTSELWLNSSSAR